MRRIGSDAETHLRDQGAGCQMATLPVFTAQTLLPLFDRRAEFFAQLIEQGFDCTRVLEDYFDGFATTPEELALSWKIRNERARRSFWEVCMLSEKGSSLAVLATPAPFHGNWYDALERAKEEGFRRYGPSEELRGILFEGEGERSRLFDIDPCGEGGR